MNITQRDAADPGSLADLASEVAATVVRVAGDIALVIGSDGVIRSVAEGSLPLLGPGVSWVGQAWADTVHPSLHGKMRSLLQQVQQHGTSERCELNHVAGQGNEIPVSWAAVRLGSNGPLLAVGRDLRAVSAIQQRFVHAQKELEHDYWLRRSAEGHYRLLFEVAHDAVVVLDAEQGQVLDANPAAAVVFGFAGPGCTGMQLREYVDASQRASLDELLRVAGSSAQGAEVRLRPVSGGASLDISATAFRAEGQLRLLLRARRAAVSAGHPGDVAHFMGQTPDAVVVTDGSGRVRWANPAFARLCQLPQAGAVTGRQLAGLLGDDERQWEGLLARARARGVVGRAPVDLRVAGAPMRSAEVSATLLAEGDQEHIGFTLRLLDRPAGLTPAGTVGHDCDGLDAAMRELQAQRGQASLPELLQQASRLTEIHFIQSALNAAGGQIDTAAATLRIPRTALLQRMDHLGLSLPVTVARDGTPPRVN